MQDRLLTALDKVTLAANVVGSVLILSLVALITADVLGRNLLGAPLSGVPELVSLSIVAIVFLQAPQALKAGRMTRSDGVIDILHARVPSLARWLETVFVIKSTLDDKSITLSDIFIGAAPFVVMMLICLAIVIAFPALTTFML